MAFDHRKASAETAVDFRRHLGGAYVPPEEVGEFAVVDTRRRETLEAWTASIVPGDAHWPSARDVGAAAYIDAVVARAPAVRPILLRAIDALDRAAEAAEGQAFGACAGERQEELLREFAAVDPSGAFDLVLELTFEAYYRDRRVCDVMKERTGFDPALPHLGSSMEPFDERLLDRVRTMPARYRGVLA
jgi:Gluconate 2-dehydrogenase subunit 3